MCQTDAPFSERAGRVGNRTSRPVGVSGTGGVPHWSSARRQEVRQGFPFGGIQAPPALTRLPGRYPGSLVARLQALFQIIFKKPAAGAGTATRTQEEEKSLSSPQSSISLWQVGGQGLGIRGDKRDRAVSDNQGRLKGKSSDQAKYSLKKKRRN
ncbi:hypothetical protein NDU88_004069 [Pleurodeles waltl]|uniref:Uncharacterized protein n=1 Tax=Pleurodeles waltl TaxID=8319 RepID=A0AAV7LHH1_PLEWA|nr:hypothetical protein NDU88_004069 [Pleurodeles waltl]